MDIALLIARVCIGLAFAAHGTQKLFGWFGGHGPKVTGELFETLGFHPGHLFAGAAASGEIVGGTLLALGLFGPVGPALVFLVMLVAAVIQLRNGFFATNNGIELPMLYAMAALVLDFTGPGVYSLDQIFNLLWLYSERNSALAIGIAIVFGLFVPIARTRSSATAAAPTR